MSSLRQNKLSQLRDNGDFDVLVVGGGVNGIGVYRDLALQGLRVLLIERSDFSSGCSAAPSRMIHGGLRYLENGEFDLVRESLAERDALLANAPHMVRPLPTVIPITSLFSGLFNSAASFLGREGKPQRRGALPIKAGLMLYDWVTRHRRALPKHVFHSGRATRRLWPDLTKRTKNSAVFHDAWISHPERLCVEMLRDTEVANGGCIALNYAVVQRHDEGFSIKDARSNDVFRVTARLVVNATGAWLDDTARSLGQPVKKPMVSGTKGSHLIIDNPRLRDALAGHMIYFENDDGRVCIVFPYQGKVLAGSTDIRVDVAERVRCEDSERDYILGSLKQVLPDVPVSEDQIVFSYSGIRPLPSSDQGYTGRISRGHFTRNLGGAVPQICMIGGKWTTFRAFAELTTDEVLRELGRNRVTTTQDLAIGGGAGFAMAKTQLCDTLTSTFDLSPDRVSHLLDHYGAIATDVAGFCHNDGDDTPLAQGCGYTNREILWLIQNEFVQTVSDIVLRRTDLAITGDVSSGIIDKICDILQQEHSLSDQSIADQYGALVSELGTYHGVKPDVLKNRNPERKPQCV
jgi:glycerol-3-phosphate dehydrogenase